MTTNIERAVEVTKIHDLFHFTSGDGWMEPYECVIRCACGEEFFSYVQTGDGSGDDDRDPDLLYRQHLAEALADAGLLMPDLPEPSRRNHRGEPIWKTEGTTKVMAPGKLPVSLSGPFGEGWDMFPIEARDTAYALLAAANLAEKSTNA